MFHLEGLEPRLCLAVTPGSLLTKPIRQELLNNLNLPIKDSLQAKLTANDLAGFDQSLLDYFVNRSNVHFFFDPSDVAGLVSYHNANLNTADVINGADQALAGQVSDPSDPDDDETRHTQWTDLGMAYRLTGNDAYADGLIDDLAEWSSNNPPLTDPSEEWRDADPHWQRLATSIHGDTWAWAYFLMVGTPKWTKEANTLFLKKTLEHGIYLYDVEPMEDISNQALIQGQGLHYIATLFPEFTSAATWETYASDLFFRCMDAQIYNDGSHAEQSPNYATAVIQRLLETKQLDTRNGNPWSSDQSTSLTKAVTALHQFLSPDGKTPAIGDTGRTSLAYFFLKANIIQGVTTWPAGKPRARDLWLLGSTAVDPFKNNPATPDLGDRGTTFPLPDSGNYIVRSGSDDDARQLIFDAGPRGSGHGHYDLLNFELFGYGRPLIADPGVYKYDSSDKRKWVISTPAHNTVSIDGKNVGGLEGEDNPGIVIDKYDAQAGYVQIAAHHWGYAGLAGRPVVTRSIWYDRDSTMLIVDWVEGVEAHNVKTSFLIPGTSTETDLAGGVIRSTNPTGGNVEIQSLLRTGQSAAALTTGIFTSNSSSDNPAATQFVVTQNGVTFTAFATLVKAYDGTTPPDTAAQWITTTPAKGTPVQLRLTKDGVSQDITFTPPKLKYPNSKGATNTSSADVAYDKNGRLHMAYYDPTAKVLKYTVRSTNGKWSPVEIVDGVQGHGTRPSIALDSLGRVGIAYTNSIDGDLMYAFNDGIVWDIETADAKGSTGLYPSLAFARFDKPFITYYDKSKLDLRLATIDEGVWKLSTIDSGYSGAKDVGKFSQIALDPSRPTSSKFAIAYHDTTGKRVLYAIQGKLSGGTVKGAYTIFEVGKSTKLGEFTSLAFDANNKATVAYYDAAISGVKFGQANRTTASGLKFTTTTAVETGTVGQFVNLYHDSSKRPTLLYKNSDTGKVDKAVFSSSKWTIKALVTGGDEIHVAQLGSKVAYTNLIKSKSELSVLFI